MSGFRRMSLWSMWAKPGIDEPSNQTPLLMIPGSFVAGTVTLLTIPAMSVNCRLMKRIFSVATCFRIAAAFLAAGLRSGMTVPPQLATSWAGIHGVKDGCRPG